ncbi:hypothetical protein FJ364_00580, partial [Candidatus Dependentiae bacterium]|nr:hypothetical protein [Candidatus Dependentiae bacterium]
MKLYVAFAFCCLLATPLASADLITINTHIFQLAQHNAYLSSSTIFDLTSQTTALCEQYIDQIPASKIFIERIAQALHLSQPQPLPIASSLASLILAIPTPLLVLYTLTQLTQAATTLAQTSTTPLTLPQLDEKANTIVLTVAAALEPFVQKEHKKKFLFWFSISCGIALGIGLVVKAYQHINAQQAKTRQALEKTHAELHRTQASYDELVQHVEELAQSLHDTSPALRQRHHNLLQEIIAHQEQLAHRIEEVDSNVHNKAAAVHRHATEGMRLVKRKFEQQEALFNRCLKDIDDAISGKKVAKNRKPAEPISFEDITGWLRAAKEVVGLAQAVQPATGINQANIGGS